ncbi:hypothetical protein BOTBODRAFT_37797 [Botryobasidium botryosum FD-172 SS1]|uniref:F-box domain-containing protein n=1 Tax=Botryobasidium botryosum (strain FD-172 SS1) TaxID=930990 RepID=A0A067LZD9_BOTB1|nr:hypothetical protein BOTBODRAFT_37797 [Botryobasidium botryosum FD-172 SS1]
MKAIPLPTNVILNIYRLEYNKHEEKLLGLSHVCRLWRDALHSFPDFWANINLHLGKRSPDRKAAYWIKRAGSKPLSIDIFSGGASPSVPSRRMSATIVRTGLVLRGCMDRWDSFTMSGSSSHQIEHLLPICTGYAPRLRVFSLNCWSISSRNNNARRLLVPLLPSVEPRSDSSRLSVSIQGYIPRFTMFGISVTRLSIDFGVDPDGNSFNLNDLGSIFQSCPNLIELDLSALRFEDMSPPLFNGAIALRRLTTLSISWIRNIEGVLNLLQLPSLESITLHEVSWSDAARAAVYNLFESSRSLSSVVIGDDDECRSRGDPAPFQESPLTLCNVTTFHVWGDWTFLGPLLDRLTLPRVQTLDLGGASHSTLHRLISLSTDLHDLSLRNLTEAARPTPAPSLTPILLPHLTSLQISGFPAFVDYIHVPQLNTLILEHRSNSARIANSGPALRAVVERSAPALTKLRLQGLNVSDEDMQWCFEHLLNLEELSITFCAISDSILSALASPPSPGRNTNWLLPRLKRFVFNENDRITPRGAIEFLASRTLNPVPGIFGGFGFVDHLSHEDAAVIVSYGDFLSITDSITYHMEIGDLEVGDLEIDDLEIGELGIDEL